MSYEERLRGPVKQGSIPPPRTPGRIEYPIEVRRSPWLTPRLMLLTLTIILLGASAGLAAALVLPNTHQARAEVLYSITAPDQGGDPLAQDRQLATQLVLLKNRAVLGPVAQKQGRQVDDLQKDIEASVVQNSTVIQVEAKGASDQAAMQTLQAVVDSYLTVARQPTAVARNLTTLLTQTREKATQLQAREQQLIPQVLAGTTPQSTLDDVRAQLTTSLDWEKTIQARINEVGVSGQAGSGAQVLTPPYAVPEPTIPRWLSSGSIGALVGVIVTGVMLSIGSRRAAVPAAGPITSPRNR
jgi:hypothetical protein